MDSKRSTSTQSRLDEKQEDNADDVTQPTTPDGQPNETQDLEKGRQPAPPSNGQDGEDPYLVKWEENETANPHNWNKYFKAFVTFQLGMLAFVGSIGTSIILPGVDSIAEEFNISREVTILSLSFFVLGFALGPALWAPLSEVYGRNVSIIPAMSILGLFSIGSALSQNPASLFITRFFGGVFGCAAVANASAALGDYYDPAARGVAITFYVVCVMGGPVLGPIIGSAIVVNPSLGWRWTEYMEAIIVAVFVLLAVFTMPELYQPVLLKRKAARLRKETGDDRYWHPHERQKMNASNTFTKYFARPLRMLCTEPMCAAIALYASFSYGVLYLTLVLFQIVYEEKRRWGPVLSTLPLLGLMVGVLSAFFINLGNQPYYVRAVKCNKGRAVPEARLPPVVLGGWLFVIGIFWFGWTANPKFHWAIPTVATVFIGAGFVVIMQQCINFLVDTYGLYAASAVSANTILRSFMAAGLPLAVSPMVRALDVGPSASLIGGIAALALPVPWIFMKYGLKLRKMSKFAPVPDD